MIPTCRYQLRIRPVAVLLIACSVLVAIAPLRVGAAEVDMTRYLYQIPAGLEAPGVHEGSFFGVPGSARLIVTSPASGVHGTIRLNGMEIAELNGQDGGGRLEIPLVLVENNAVTASWSGSSAGPVTIRVKQMADIELHVQSRFHFNANVSNFAAAREFYGMLGFETLTGFPDTNTLEMARAIGIETPTAYDGSQGEAAGGYLLHGELIGVGGFQGGLIDLIEFTIPRNEEPPYARTNHLGMARAVMLTTDIAADYEHLTKAGVQFLSPPAIRADGSRFVVFTDPDGVYYELSEIAGENHDAQAPHIVGLAQVNVNVSDFERSRAWYQMLGYDVTRRLPVTESIEVANAMGFDEAFEIDGAIVTHPADGSTLELVQWLAPHDPERAYSVPVNHFGMHRMAFSTSDIEADVETLKAQGVEFISEITPCCSGPDSWGSIVAFYDPDGTVVEFVEQPFMNELFSFIRWIRKIF